MYKIMKREYQTREDTKKPIKFRERTDYPPKAHCQRLKDVWRRHYSCIWKNIFLVQRDDKSESARYAESISPNRQQPGECLQPREKRSLATLDVLAYLKHRSASQEEIVDVFGKIVVVGILDTAPCGR